MTFAAKLQIDGALGFWFRGDKNVAVWLPEIGFVINRYICTLLIDDVDNDFNNIVHITIINNWIYLYIGNPMLTACCMK